MPRGGCVARHPGLDVPLLELFQRLFVFVVAVEMLYVQPALMLREREKVVRLQRFRIKRLQLVHEQILILSHVVGFLFRVLKSNSYRCSEML